MKVEVLRAFNERKEEVLEDLLDSILSYEELAVALMYHPSRGVFVLTAPSQEIYSMINTIPVYVVEYPIGTKELIEDWEREDQIAFLEEEVLSAIEELDT